MHFALEENYEQKHQKTEYRQTKNDKSGKKGDLLVKHRIAFQGILKFRKRNRRHRHRATIGKNERFFSALHIQLHNAVSVQIGI